MTQEEISIRLGVDQSTLDSGLESAKRGVERWVDNVKDSVGEAFKMLAGPLAGVGLAEAFDKISEKAEAISRAAEATGMSVEQVQEFGHAVREAGESSDDAERALEKLSDLIGQNDAKFHKGGISIKDATGELLDTQTVVDEISDKMAGMESESQKAAMAVDLLGREGAKLVGVLGDGAGALHEKGKGGAIFSQEDIDTVKGMKDTVLDLGESIAAALIKPITFLTGGTARGLLRESLENTKETIRAIRAMQAGAGAESGAQPWDADPANTAKMQDLQKEIDRERDKEKTHLERGLELLQQVADLKDYISKLDQNSNLYKEKELELTLAELKAYDEISAAHKEQKADRSAPVDVTPAAPSPTGTVHFDATQLYKRAGYGNVHTVENYHPFRFFANRAAPHNPGDHFIPHVGWIGPLEGHNFQSLGAPDLHAVNPNEPQHKMEAHLAKIAGCIDGDSLNINPALK